MWVMTSVETPGSDLLIPWKMGEPIPDTTLGDNQA
jgi:hypothetical protein